eukprot:GGOE01012498.1.p1 GENE.GGOE01012498.1~~GGOE01012498.1.p1  ORF type:complete len:384 (-),score=90.22 GGOE01012498.1:2006-3157(-)
MTAKVSIFFRKHFCVNMYRLAVLLFALSFEAFPCTGAGKGTPVAVYLVGEPWTLNQTLCSLADHILQPLAQQGFSASIFTYARRHPTVGQYDLLATALPGVQIISSISNSTPTIPSRCVEDLSHRFQGEPERSRDLLLRMHDMETIDGLRRRHEAETGVQFQWVLLLRPDVTYIDPIPNLHALSTSHIHVPVSHPFGSMQEGVAIISRSLTAHYFGVYTDLCILDMVRTIPVEVQNVERLYRWLLHFYLIPISAIRNFFFIRTRAHRTNYGHFASQDVMALGPDRCDRALRYRCFLPAAGGKMLASPSHAAFPHVAARLASQCWRATPSNARRTALLEKYIEQLTGQTTPYLAVRSMRWYDSSLGGKALQVFWSFARSSGSGY